MIIKYENINNYNSTINSFYNNINIYKKSKIGKLKNLQDKQLSIIGEYLLKELVEEKYNINYNHLLFKYNNYHKPYITNHDIYFNISHSHEYSVCIISKKECGIDIEKIRNFSINTIKQYATPNELKYILSNEKEKYLRCFEIFCLKEAYFKMLGTGIQDLKQIEFKISNKTITCSDSSAKCKLNYNIPNYIIAICEKNEE